ncbi:RnfABCDGE type electron transport complex subunit D [Pseudobutyrivibrio xylanivorans]|uniref:Ion-translocating oxidoreductase complex subunit D n=1 Tax=Pseudobutyrivibrio xylanivorans TaxID=185007 RepID=A0A5P6VSI9_PSEXY|nr:RnfABCDGE type electron transport complex subunit D [Pseudobutyrivibrio xylanivorans]QFJ55665.1 RnfABCDGE type electron transport complex subunit D [Pseudobutyrivibrio xylanivorans]
MSELLRVSSSPHVRAKDDTSRIMLYVIIALMPTTIYGIFNFGLRALLLILVCILTCVLSEYLFELATHKKNTIKDLSAVVTGLLLALNLPYTLPVWQAVLGSVFAIVVVKMLFGGIGQNFMNPALGGRAFLLISFAGTMTHFEYDGYASATPLQLLKQGETVNTFNMLLGRTGGTIGETSALLILLGAIILILFGVINLWIPGTYILSFVLFISLFGGHGFDTGYIVAHLCGGGLMLGAFFMATDYATSPVTPLGRVVFGICLGVLTGLFRLYGNSAEGVSYAIIFCNLLVPLIERVTVPRAFGIPKASKPKEVKANE